MPIPINLRRSFNVKCSYKQQETAQESINILYQFSDTLFRYTMSTSIGFGLP